MVGKKRNISRCSVLSRRQTCCSVLPSEIIIHDAYIGERSENNIKCVLHDDLGWKNRTTRYNCRFSAASLALRVVSQFHRCGTYSVLSRSPSIFNSITLTRFFGFQNNATCGSSKINLCATFGGPGLICC